MTPKVVGWKLEALEEMCSEDNMIKLNLKIRGVDFDANLILLESKGTYVTLGIGLVKQA
jgi:hypothetical protein